MIANYARVVCAVNLQLLSNILNKAWAFSVANDSSTHYGKSYFDNRIRIHHDGDILNIHAIAIPMFEGHTGENMFNLITTFLILFVRHGVQSLSVLAQTVKIR